MLGTYTMLRYNRNLMFTYLYAVLLLLRYSDLNTQVKIMLNKSPVIEWLNKLNIHLT